MERSEVQRTIRRLERLKRVLLDPQPFQATVLDGIVYPWIIRSKAAGSLRGRRVLRRRLTSGACHVCRSEMARASRSATTSRSTRRTAATNLNLYAPVKLMADRPGAEIVSGVCLHAYKRITIGENCLIAGNTQIFDGSAHDLCAPDVEKPIAHCASSRAC
jgi:hypothetical protein